MKICAMFIGQDLSLNFRNGLYYEIDIEKMPSGNYRIIAGGKVCEYTTIFNFFKNWTDISTFNRYAPVAIPKDGAPVLVTNAGDLHEYIRVSTGSIDDKNCLLTYALGHSGKLVDKSNPGKIEYWRIWRPLTVSDQGIITDE